MMNYTKKLTIFQTFLNNHPLSINFQEKNLPNATLLLPSATER